MLEYKNEDQTKILKTLIYELDPMVAVKEMRNLPAYLIFMMIRYTDFVNEDERVRSLLMSATGYLKKRITKKTDKRDYGSLLWLSNLLRLLHLLKQYSGDKAFTGSNTDIQNSHALQNFDLSEYRQVFSDLSVWMCLVSENFFRGVFYVRNIFYLKTRRDWSGFLSESNSKQIMEITNILLESDTYRQYFMFFLHSSS